MKRIPTLITYFVAVALVIFSANTADAASGSALIRNVVGTASYTGPGGSGPLRAGLALGEGTTITTGAGSHVDIYMPNNGGIIRLEANSTVKFDTLRFRKLGAGSSFETNVNVTRGNVVANVVKKLSRASRYQVRTPTGIAGIRGTSLRAGAGGLFTLTGTVNFTFNNGQVQLVIGGTILPVGSTSPIKATQAQTTGLAQVAAGSTLNATGSAELVQQTLQTFATAIAAQAAQDAGNENAAATAAAVTKAVVQALVTAVQNAANELPPAQRARVQQAVTALNSQVQTIQAKAAANATVAAVISNGGTPAQAQTAANQAADGASTDAGARTAAKGQISRAVTAAQTGGSLAAMVDNVAAQTGPTPPPAGPGNAPPPPPTTDTTLIPVTKDVQERQQNQTSPNN